MSIIEPWEKRLFLRHRQGDISIRNRNQSESDAEISWNNFRDRHKKICKINVSWASDGFKSRNIYRRNKTTAAAVVT